MPSGRVSLLYRLTPAAVRGERATNMSRPLESLRRTLVDSRSSASLSDRLRARRFRLIYETFPDITEMHVLDLGGTVSFWLKAHTHPSRVTLVNVSDQHSPEPWMQCLVGDVCEPPAALQRESFDLVFSNSVIEHVGGHARRLRMAEVVHDLGDHHWIQTPYRYFPIEPHWLFPGFQFLPTKLQGHIGARWPLTWSGRVPYENALADAMDVELLDRTQMQHYFPGSRLVAERVMGIPKSLIAIR